MTEAEALQFMEEFNTLLNKYKLYPIDVVGPIISFRETTTFQAGLYCGLCGPQKEGTWTFSAPWGG